MHDNKQEAFTIWLDHTGNDIDSDDINNLIGSFRDDFQGEYKDEEDFAYEIVKQCYNLREFAQTYFDYEKFARDLFMTDYGFEAGFVFRNS